MGKPLPLITLLVFFTCLSATELRSQVLDQISSTSESVSGWAIGERNAQTVTVGVGGYLAKIELPFYQSDEIANGDLVVEIFGIFSSGAPDTSALLGSVLIENSSIPTQTQMRNAFQYTAVDFSSQNLFFNAGDQFAIIPRRTDLSNWGRSPWILWPSAGNGESYDNGSLFLFGFLEGWQRNTSDHSFRTFMSTEPMILGDCNLDGVVNFLDIAPFIEFLLSGGYSEQADIDRSGEVTFLDVAPLIEILGAG